MSASTPATAPKLCPTCSEPMRRMSSTSTFRDINGDLVEQQTWVTACLPCIRARSAAPTPNAR